MKDDSAWWWVFLIWINSWSILITLWSISFKLSDVLDALKKVATP